MFDVPNVTIASKCCLEDPEWKPPFEAGIVITNFAFNGDESTLHLHMTFVPYSDNCSRGQKNQNALAQTFTRMGYKTTMEQARDASDELVWQDTSEGKKPQMVRTAYGAVEWKEEQKNWIAEEMEKSIGWKRLFKGKNERGDLLLSDHRRGVRQRKHWKRNVKKKSKKMLCITFKPCQRKQSKSWMKRYPPRI